MHFIPRTEFDQIASYPTPAILWPKRQGDQTFSTEAIGSEKSEAVGKVASTTELLDHANGQKFVAIVLKNL